MLITTGISFLIAATSVWVEDSLARVTIDMPPQSSRDLSHRLYLARGERESFQIAIRTTREETLESIEARPVNADMGPPELRWVGYIQQGPGTAASVGPNTLVPDPLLPFEPGPIPADITRSVWVTYTAPRDMRPGIYTNEIVVRAGRRVRRTIHVTLEVFDMELPETPRLRTLFTLDRSAIRRVHGIQDRPLDDWTAIYDSLAPYRLSYSIWDGGPLVAAQGTRIDTQMLREHLAHAVRHGQFNTIDVGAGERLSAVFPPPREGVVQDPLQLYLYDMNNWLQEQGWLERAVVNLGPVGLRAEWAGRRAESFRVSRADSRVARILESPLHPFLERYADYWAVSTPSMHPTGLANLRSGLSLAGDVTAGIAGAKASSSAESSVAIDATDGSPFSVWKPAPADRKPWIEIAYAELVDTGVVNIITAHPVEPILYTALDDGIHRRATARWSWEPVSVPMEGFRGEARLRVPKTFTRLRLEFEQPPRARTIEVAEVFFGELSRPHRLPDSRVPIPWLAADKAAFPALRAGARTLEYKLLPWICWGYDLAGFTGGSLNTWPAAWRAYQRETPEIWPAASTEDFLFYPGPDGLLPSIRAELLRDALEDFDYLAMLEDALGQSTEVDRKLEALLERQPLLVGEAYLDWDALKEDHRRRRVAIGRALSGL